METRCRQLVSLLRERRETLCSLEADHDQVGSVVPGEVEGKSAANGCTRSLGSMEAPGALVETRIPGVIVPSVIVPVCAVKGVSAIPCVSETPCMDEPPCVSGVVTSVPGCVLPSTPCMSEQPVCVKEAPCVSGMVCANERHE